jgi:hypothetical protein
LTGFGPKTDLAWHRWSTRSWFHTKTSLIGHIPRPWNGPAAMNEVSCLQTAMLWSHNGWMSIQTFDWILPSKLTWLGTDGPSGAGIHYTFR